MNELKVTLTIVTMLLERGFTDRSKTYPADGFAAIMKHRAELEDFQGADFYKRERKPYNCTDRDGAQMYDGDVRYYWDYHGRLVRGVVYRNINNMWWVHTSPYSYWNVASSELFTWTPAMGRRKVWPREHIEKKLREKLDRAVKSESFERAITLRDLLKGRAA